MTRGLPERFSRRLMCSGRLRVNSIIRMAECTPWITNATVAIQSRNIEFNNEWWHRPWVEPYSCFTLKANIVVWNTQNSRNSEKFGKNVEQKKIEKKIKQKKILENRKNERIFEWVAIEKNAEISRKLKDVWNLWKFQAIESLSLKTNRSNTCKYACYQSWH